MGLAADLIALLAPVRRWPEPKDGGWREASFCVIDLETTGLDLARDEIISIGAVRIEEGRISSQTLDLMASPQRDISQQSIAVHSILPAEVADSPPVSEHLSVLRDFVSGAVLVAHAAWFDRAFLDRALRGRRERLPRGIVDTAALARHLGIVDVTGREPTLENLMQCLSLPSHSPHTALGDAYTTAMALLAMIGRMEAHGEVSVAQLIRVSRE